MPPRNEYRCEHGHEFEVEQRISDEPLGYCTAEAPGDWAPCCAPVRRLMPRGTTFVLGGSGWEKDGCK